MKIMLCENVPYLGMIGEVVEVKDGYARNYLLPHGLAAEPTAGNLKRIEAEKEAYLARVAKEKAEIEARAQLVDGKEITIAARANEEGHLYGSVGPAQIVEALAAAGIVVDEKDIVLDEPFHTLDKYDIKLNFGHEVTATVGVWIVPVRDESDEDAGGRNEQSDQADEAESNE